MEASKTLQKKSKQKQHYHHHLSDNQNIILLFTRKYLGRRGQLPMWIAATDDGDWSVSECLESGQSSAVYTVLTE